MSDGVWIFLGFVVLAVVILKVKGGGSKAPAKNDVMDRFKQKDALVPEIVQECVRAAKALPIVDKATSPLFHEPVYDAKSDLFDPPCKENDFQWTTGRCWDGPDTIHKAFEMYADREASDRLGLARPRSSCMIPAGDHIDVIHCDYSVNEPGVSVLRVSRVAEDLWHVYQFTCGRAPGAMGLSGGKAKLVLTSEDNGIDPPILAVDVAQDPTRWTQREEKLRRRWKLDGNWRDAARLCTHKPQA